MLEILSSSKKNTYTKKEVDEKLSRVLALIEDFKKNDRFTELDLSKIIKGQNFELDHDTIDLMNETIFANMSKNDLVMLSDNKSISLSMLATVSALAVGTGIVINNNDDLYDLGRIFYEKNKENWDTVKSIFMSTVAFNTAINKVKVGKEFLNIVKNTFDDTFVNSSDDIYIDTPFNVLSGYGHQAYVDKKSFAFGSDLTLRFDSFNRYSSYTRYRLSYSYTNIEGKRASGNTTFVDLSSNTDINFITSFEGRYLVATPLGDTKLHGTSTGKFDLISFLHSKGVNVSDLEFTYFPYQGTYNPGNVLDNDIDISIPNNLGDLVGNVNPGYVTGELSPPWVGTGDISIPNVDNPSISICEPYSFAKPKNILSIREKFNNTNNTIDNFPTIETGYPIAFSENKYPNDLTLSIKDNEVFNKFSYKDTEAESSNTFENTIKMALNKNGLYINGIKCNTEDSISILEGLSNSDALKIGVEGEIADNIDYNSVRIYHSLKNDSDMIKLTTI